MILSESMEDLHHCRIVALIKNGFKYKVARDLMDKEIASIWLKIGGQGRKSIMVGGGYTESIPCWVQELHLIQIVQLSKKEDGANI